MQLLYYSIGGMGTVPLIEIGIETRLHWNTLNTLQGKRSVFEYHTGRTGTHRRHTEDLTIKNLNPGRELIP